MTVTVLGRKLPATATYAAALGLSLILLLAAVAGAFWVAQQQHVRNQSLRSAVELRTQLRNTLSALQDAETGQRGYLITGEERYLEPYNAAVAQWSTLLPRFEQIATSNPQLGADIRRMGVVASDKMNELTETVRLTREGHHDAALRIVRDDRGKRDMDEARAIVARVMASEPADIGGNLSAAERNADRLRLIVLIAALMLVAIGALAIATVRQGMQELRASRDAAEAANVNLLDEIERRRVTEAKMVQMQKMEAIGQLTGGVAHDFNNMLAVITSALSLMRRRIERGESDVMQFIDGAQDAARRAATLTGRLLAFARRSPLSPGVTDVNKLVGGMSELLRRTLGEQIDMETVLAGGLWKVYADVSQLENAIVNICVNARDAMKGGGKLTIETGNAFLDEAYARANPDVSAGQYAMIAITDTGAGMAPEVVARAFEPFFTTKEAGQGTGLGLSHVHGFLKQTGGHVSIYSEMGVGTTVKLYLPRTQRTDEASAAAVKTETPMGDPSTVILVVEDEERVRALSVASLREFGYTVLHAANGDDALEILRTHPNISLLFTDIVMPGMSGRVLADRARQSAPDLRVLYTTGYTQNAIVHNGVVDADARLILKPYSLEDLAQKVRAVLDEKQDVKSE